MNCSDNHIPINKHLENMARKSGQLVGLPIVEVSGHTDSALRCDNNHLNFSDLLALCIGVDGCGKPAIRVKIIDSCETFLSCSTTDKNPLLNQVFAYDSTEKTYALVLNQST